MQPAMRYLKGVMFLSNMLAFYDPFGNREWQAEVNGKTVSSMAEALMDYGFAYGDVSESHDYI